MEYYSFLKEYRITKFEEKWIGLEIILLNEFTNPKEKKYALPYIRILVHNTYIYNKHTTEHAHTHKYVCGYSVTFREENKNVIKTKIEKILMSSHTKQNSRKTPIC